MTMENRKSISSGGGENSKQKSNLGIKCWITESGVNQ
jgi:hypothetical protein